MKTEVHTIDGASLSRIEELGSSLDYPVPNWVPYTVAIPGTETSTLDRAMVETQHYSGLLRECSNSDYTLDGQVEDESGNMHDIAELFDNAAERLDQAHQEWLEHEVKAPLLNIEETQTLQMILMTYCEDCDSDEETGKEVDALFAKIRGG